MGGRGFESRQKRPKLKDENFSILGDASFSHKKFIPNKKSARSSASISRVCPGRVGADPGTNRRFACFGHAYHTTLLTFNIFLTVSDMVIHRCRKQKIIVVLDKHIQAICLLAIDTPSLQIHSLRVPNSIF